MRSAALYLKDPNTSRFLGGGLSEVVSLLGSPLPPLPPTERENGRDVFHVHFHPHLRTLLQRYLGGLLREIGGEPAPPSRKQDAAREQAEYESVLARVLRSVRCNDRRMGLPSLFWLAHSRDVAECLREMEGKTPAVRKLKYSLHPLLSSFYRRLEDAARRGDEQDGTGEAPASSSVMVDSIIEDGFAFTEPTISDLDFNLYLAHNKRYRLSADLFFEIYTILVRETERRLREGERGLLARVGRHLPQLSREQCQTQAGVVKVMMNAEVLAYLLGDAWSVGSRLTASPRLRAETERRRPAEVVDVFLDLLAGVKRFEVVAHVRDRVRLLRAFDDAREMEEKASRGQRLYEFGDSAQVINNAANATIFFLDLRGFTKTSEGQISERDLTRELYTVFDAFVPHVRRFGGKIDKFLGDGIMVTYGTDYADPLNPLNAVRTAVLCQETLRRLRGEGQTYFKMGIAVHHGRVYLARFLTDDDRGADHRHRPHREPGRAALVGLAAEGRRRRDGRGVGPHARARHAHGHLRVPRSAWTRRHAHQRGHRHQPRRAAAARGAPAAGAHRGRPGPELRVLRRADRPPAHHPLRGRRQVQGRAFELSRL